MVQPRNEPDAPPSTGKPGRTFLGWILLAIAVLVIIVLFAMNARRPGAGMGGDLSNDAGRTSQAEPRPPG